jgi:chorismate mutase/prephenate dehydratase
MTVDTTAELEALRSQMNDINTSMLQLFEQRMDVAAQIAACKRESGKPVNDPTRERAILKGVREQASPQMESYATVLFSLLMEMSRGHQAQILNPSTPLRRSIEDAIQATPQLFPPTAMVACQGVEGAYSQIACDKIFKHPTISYFKNFEGVFQAIEAGFCEYGVLPLENSSAGTVNEVYDLMMEHDFHIVRTCRLKVDHDLLALPGAELAGITEIYSHEQAIGQCAKFLESLPGVKVTPVANTAEAARLVAESGRSDVAALSSRNCAALYGLKALKTQVNDTENNYTRFACITKDLQVFPGADRASLMLVLAHEPGSLYKVLARLYSLDINLTKLESRPMPGRDFEFMFYFDLETPVYSPEFATLVCELQEICEDFKYLGSYSEIA